MLQALERRAEREPHAVAIQFGSHEITYERLLDAVGRLAIGLHNLGIQPADQVAILLPNLPQFIISYLALSKIGATIVLLNPDMSTDNLRHVFYITRLKGCITLDRLESKLNEVSHPNSGVLRIFLGDQVPAGCINLTQLMADSSQASGAIQTTEDTRPVLIGFSPGTVSKSEGICFDQTNLSHQIYSVQRTLQLRKSDDVVCIPSLAGLLSLVPGMAAPLATGCRVILLPKADPRAVCEAIRPGSSTLVFADHDFYSDLLQIDDIGDIAKHIRLAICLGPGANPVLLRELQKKLGLSVRRSYGMVEAGGLLALSDDDSVHTDATVVGLPSIGIEMQITDNGGKRLPSESSGEILIKSDGLTSGYLETGQGKSNRFRNGWFRTGDVGKLDLFGRLHCQGRKREIIYKGGFIVAPADVEQVLLSHYKIRQCRVLGVSHDHLGSEVKAVIVPKPGQNLSIKDITKFCQQKLPNYMCPKDVEIVGSLNVESKGRVN